MSADPRTRLHEALAACPLLPVLRGIRPDEAEPIGEALVGAGFTLLEVPLNSPDPFDSIARLARRFGDRVLVGAGTVLRPEDVARVAAAGGRLIVSPNTDAAVIGATVAAGLPSLPGCYTPSEAFAALGAGATALKLFPAELAGPAGLKALRAVLPPGVAVVPSGGITPATIRSWRDAGAAGFGLGSALYAPGDGPGEVGAKARAFVAALADR